MVENQLSRPSKSLLGAMLALVFFLFPFVIIVIAARPWLPSLASQHGAGIDAMINYQLLTVGAVFLIAHVVLAYFIWRFSRQEKPTFRLARSRTEWRWAIIPVIIMSLIAEGGVLIIGLPVWKEVYASGPAKDALTIEVTAEQFVWNVRYAGEDGVFGKPNYELMSTLNPLGLSNADTTARDDIYLLNELKLPVNKPVHILLRSKDVIHSLFLPHHRVKQDAVPGMTIDVFFTPNKVGEFELACTELCGLGHYRMRGFVYVMAEDEFEKWLAEDAKQSRYYFE